MKSGLEIKTRDILIVVGIIVAILIGISTQWAIAGQALFGSLLY